MVDYRCAVARAERLERELAECCKKLATAEARMQKARELIREAETDVRPGTLMDRILDYIDCALQSDHAALDAMLEQARAEEAARRVLSSE